ncbi:hypothetical protein F4804DRAFT_309684 [Jackrogersella minutella]|nr:hypothetical protein F4804DRAFT_309684 [Jackrogersella minutella]
MRRSLTVSALALAATQLQVHAQELDQTIVGCAELDCPASSADTANDNCTIADTGSFPNVGLTRVPSSDAALAGLSWVKGFNVTDPPTGNRTFHSSFYLGAPSSLALNASTGACAVFLHGAAAWSLAFGVNGTGETAQGTCSEAMGSTCVDAIVARAKELVGDYTDSDDVTSTVDACAKLQSDLLDSTLDACTPISKGSWTNFTSVALTGDGAPTAISQEQNSSSACWPITPKEDSLTLVTEYTVEGNDFVADAEEAQWTITPILTVFYPASNGSVVDTIDASLSCVKAMGPAKASLDTINDGTNDTDSGATALSSPNSLTTAVSCFTAAVLFGLYAAF